MNQIRKQFEENKVLLWGEKKAPSKMLDEYNHGNKNPHSTARIKPVLEPKAKKEAIKKVVRTFSLEEDYGIQDLPFLNKEFDRLDDEMSGIKDMDKLDELGEIQEKIYDLIEGLERLKKMAGKGLIMKPEHYYSDPITDDDLIGGKIKNLIGRGFKKGSPEALAHAQKMREVLIAKKGLQEPKPIKQIIASKARVIKGSEEAKALGKRLAEAKKKKLEEIKKEKEETISKTPVEPFKKKGKPWYYIGDMPKGYREATEDEAVIAKKISLYGKYEVDMTKWTLFRDYNMLLSRDKTDKEAEWSMNGIKKRVLETLREIEVMKAKINKNPDKPEFKSDLEMLKEKKKYLQAGYNFYYRLLCERKGKEYKRQKIELPIIEFKVQEKSEEETYVPKKHVIIDPRTGEPAEFTYTGEEKPKEKEEEFIYPELSFKKGNDIITLSLKFFTPDYKLIPKYAKKLTEKNIYLNKKHYTKEDSYKYFYHKLGEGIKSNHLVDVYEMMGKSIVKRHTPYGSGVSLRRPDKKKRVIIQSVIFDKDYWNKIEAKKWLKDNEYFNDNCDEKEDTYRFRQFNPEDLNDRKFITKKLNNGVSLILSIKK